MAWIRDLSVRDNITWTSRNAEPYWFRGEPPALPAVCPGMILTGSRRRQLLVTLACLAGASILILLGAMSSRDPSKGGGDPPGTIQSSEREKGFVVAAVQFSSRMGEADWNRERLLALVAEAALSGADVVVLPETAVQGYMTPDGEVVMARVSPLRAQNRRGAGSPGE